MRIHIEELFNDKENIDEAIKFSQCHCPHETSVYEAGGSSGNWDNDPSYWYLFYCYDCRKRWSTDQSNGSGSSMRVDKIDYDEKPEIIELKIKIENLKR